MQKSFAKEKEEKKKIMILEMLATMKLLNIHDRSTTGSRQELDQDQGIAERVADHVAEPQVLSDARRGQPVAGSAAAHRRRRRGAGPGAGQPAQQELYPHGHGREGHDRRQRLRRHGRLRPLSDHQTSQSRLLARGAFKEFISCHTR